MYGTYKVINLGEDLFYPVFRIRIGLNADPDPDPGFSWAKKKTVKKDLCFYIKNYNLIISRLP